MPTPHKHAALIKAWADGAEMEYSAGHGLRWHPTTHPSWTDHILYRIKLQEPDYGTVAKTAFYKNLDREHGWGKIAAAVIEAYKQWEKEQNG